MIKSNLAEVAKDMSRREIAKVTGCHFEIIRRLYNDEMERYPRDVLDKLCAYFKCEVGDLLKYEEENKEDQ